jgi:hypothetical protein
MLFLIMVEVETWCFAVICNPGKDMEFVPRERASLLYIRWFIARSLFTKDPSLLSCCWIDVKFISKEDRTPEVFDRAMLILDTVFPASTMILLRDLLLNICLLIERGLIGIPGECAL